LARFKELYEFKPYGLSNRLTSLFLDFAVVGLIPAAAEFVLANVLDLRVASVGFKSI